MTPKTRVRSGSALGSQQLLAIHEVMVLGREMDEAERRLRRQGRYLFQLSAAGHDAIQAVAAHLMRPGRDWFYPYYRDRTFCLGIGVPPRDLLRQGFAKASDPSSGGRQMPNHFGSARLHIVSQSSPTGTQYLQAVGTAEAGMLARELAHAPGAPAFADGELVYVSSGEGATSEGEFYEAVSAAALRRAPVLFLIEDNEYAISVPVEAQTPGGSISRVFRDFPGLLTLAVDGLDVDASYGRLAEAVAHVRSGAGPALVHAHVARLHPHSDSDDDSLYRTVEERASAATRDPLTAFSARLVDEGLLTRDDVERVHDEARQGILAAIDEVLEEEEPRGDTVERFLFAPEIATPVETYADPDGEPVTLVAAVNRTIELEMASDVRVVVFGEDVADCSREDILGEVKGKGGVFKATENLQRLFGSHRVFNSQLAEASIVGRAIGMAIRGFRPVVEIQFFDYIWPAVMQIRNELAMMRWRSNNSFSCPVVIRVPIGGYVRGGGIYHSQSGESIFCHCPGLRVVMPSNASDASGLLRASIQSGDPVLFLEHKHLYRQRYARRPYQGAEYVIPLGKAATVRAGRDVTLVTYGAQVQKSLAAAESLAADGIDVEVIDLRSLVPYDWDAIAASVERTGRLVIVYEDNRAFGFGAEIAARAADELFEDLDAPVGRIGSLDTPVGYAPELVEATLPRVDQIEALLARTVRF